MKEIMFNIFVVAMVLGFIRNTLAIIFLGGSTYTIMEAINEILKNLTCKIVLTCICYFIVF